MVHMQESSIRRILKRQAENRFKCRLNPILLHPTYTIIAFVFIAMCLVATACHPRTKSETGSKRAPSTLGEAAKDATDVLSNESKSASEKLADVQEIVENVVSLVPERGLSVPLLTGLIAHESRFDANARAFESNAFGKIRSRVRNVHAARELSTSYGLTQVLGETARVWGVSVSELRADPELQVHLGGLQLARCLRHERGDKFWALACYNAGARRQRNLYPRSARSYAAKVLRESAKFKTLTGEDADTKDGSPQLASKKTSRPPRS